MRNHMTKWFASFQGCGRSWRSTVTLRIGLAGVLCTAGAWGQQYVISTFAGVGLEVPWLSAPALNASIGWPTGVVVDHEGQVYFSGNQCVFRLDSSGTLTRLAGTGRVGYSGDGGPANSARLSPAGVAVDTSGNLYIATLDRIRKVSPDGIITSVAGGGSERGDGGLATSARLNGPAGIAVDRSGNLYIAETENHRIRKVSADGVITTAAGTGTPGYSGDGGPATSAPLFAPTGVSLDSSGNLYFTEPGNREYCSGRIRKVSAGGIITTVSGTAGVCNYSGDGGRSTDAHLSRPSGVAVDSFGSIYIADTNNGRIRKVSAIGIITTVAGGPPGDGGPATNAQLNYPTDVAVDASGNLYIVDSGDHRVRRVSADGIIATVAGTGSPGYSGDGGPATGAQLDTPVALAVDRFGNLYVAEATSQCCSAYRVRKVSADGIITTVVPTGRLAVLNVLAADSAGNLYVAESQYDTLGASIFGDDFGRILKVSSDGTITTVAGAPKPATLGDGGPATSALLDYPAGVAVDSSGNLYIAEWFGHRIRKVSPDGIIITVAGAGTRGYSGDGGPATAAQISNPNGVAVDSFGNVYFPDSSNNRIRKVSADGIITTVAGTGTLGYSGDGGPATDAELSFLSGIAVDSNGGKIYVAEPANNTVRLVEAVR